VGDSISSENHIPVAETNLLAVLENYPGVVAPLKLCPFNVLRGYPSLVQIKPASRGNTGWSLAKVTDPAEGTADRQRNQKLVGSQF